MGGGSSFGGYFFLARLTAAGTLDPGLRRRGQEVPCTRGRSSAGQRARATARRQAALRRGLRRQHDRHPAPGQRRRRMGASGWRARCPWTSGGPRAGLTSPSSRTARSSSPARPPRATATCSSRGFQPGRGAATRPSARAGSRRCDFGAARRRRRASRSWRDGRVLVAGAGGVRPGRGASPGWRATRSRPAGGLGRRDGSGRGARPMPAGARAAPAIPRRACCLRAVRIVGTARQRRAARDTRATRRDRRAGGRRRDPGPGRRRRDLRRAGGRHDPRRAGRGPAAGAGRARRARRRGGSGTSSRGGAGPRPPAPAAPGGTAPPASGAGRSRGRGWSPRRRRRLVDRDPGRRWQRAAAGIVVGDRPWRCPGDPASRAFGTGGRLSIDLGGNDAASSLFLLPDGRMLLAGSGEANHEVVALLAAGRRLPGRVLRHRRAHLRRLRRPRRGQRRGPHARRQAVVVDTLLLLGPLMSIVVLRRNADGSQDNSVQR